MKSRNIDASICFRDPFFGKQVLGRCSLLGVNDQHLPEVASKRIEIYFIILTCCMHIAFEV